MPQNVYKRHSGNGCVECGLLANTNKHRKWTNKLVAEHLITGPHTGSIRLLSEFRTINDSTTFSCNTCLREFTTAANNVLGKLATGCPSCAGRKLNTIYLYQLGSTGIHKVDLTSDHRGTERIRQVCSKHNTTPDIILMETVDYALTELKASIKARYSKYLANIRGDGYTEMFKLVPEQVEAIKQEILQYVSK